ncbi:MAG TPA: GvpL/GvpF family gas vesicle protein [Humisphaera sp.]|jgi:hypothetical protein|nr:GvpL/GvpF family gas vesicle protein [Humisphaera sp.]
MPGELSSVLSGPAIDPNFPIELLESDDLLAIVSQVSLAEFGQSALDDRVNDPAWVETKIRAHDKIIKNARSLGSIIPCRFCTILRSRQDVEDLLRHHRRRIAAKLAALDGKSEWGVKLWLAAPSNASQPQEISGKAYLQHKRNARDHRRQLQRPAEDRAEQFHKDLAATAAEAALLPIRDRAGEDSAEIALNGAYLVADQQRTHFEDEIADWSNRHAAEGWRVEITGPWPPYNFAQLDLSMEAAA